MKTTDLILLQQVCKHHEIELNFIYSLKELNLIEVVVFDGCEYVLENQLKEIEKMIRFHRELNINIQGIDAIYILLEQIKNLESELAKAHNKLREFNIE